MPDFTILRWGSTLARVVSGRAPTGARDTAYHLQIYAIACISLLVSAAVYVPTYLLWMEEPVGALAIGLAAIAGLSTLPLYLATRSVRLALQAMSAAIFTVTSFLTWYQGGLSAPVAPWLLIVPFALSIAGMSGPAGVWFLIVIVEMLTLGAMDLAGHPLPQHRGSDPIALFVVSQPGLCSLIFVFLMLVNRARRLAFADLHTQNEELSTARDMAMDAVRAKSRFLANMSHEIRTPLNGVLGTADVLASTPLTAEQRRFVAMLKQSGDSLLALINDVLDFSKIEAGKVQLEDVEFDLRELAEGVAELFAPRAAEKGLICICRVSPWLPERIRGDPLRLRQVLVNLLSNAIKFTSLGEVALEVVPNSRSRDGDVDIDFRVIDTGIGIDATARRRLFQAFSQGDDTTTRVFGGTGLGLAISGELVRLMASRITVDSEPNKGSCFQFTLRRRATTISGSANGRVRSFDSSAAVAVLETHPRSRVVLIEILETLGRHAVVFDDVAKLASAIHSGTCPSTCIVNGRVLKEAAWECIVSVGREASSSIPRIIVTMPFGKSPAYDGDAVRFPVIHHPMTRAAVRDTVLGSRQTNVRTEPVAPTDALAGCRVLLVEDNPVNQQIALAMLTRLGCNVALATDGYIGIRTWKEQSFDVVLMDCQMPVVDGFDAAREIRAAEEVRGLNRTPIIALTANALAGDREQCLDAGMDDHLGKPFTQDMLRAIVAKWWARDRKTVEVALSRD